MPRRRRHRLGPDERAAIAARAARREVLRRHARLDPRGEPVLCIPSRDELANDRLRKAGPGTDGRPIYDTRAAAEAAARELEALGTRPLRPYECPRSPHRHHLHLTTDRSPATKRRLVATGRQRTTAPTPPSQEAPRGQ